MKNSSNSNPHVGHKKSGSGTKKGDSVEIEDGSSVSKLVRQLEVRLQTETASATAKSGSLSSGSSANSEMGEKRSNFLAKLKKSGNVPPAEEFVMSSPSNFQHNMHVDFEYNWGTDPSKVLQLGIMLGQGAYGQVMEAKYINTNYLMAVKIIPLIAAGKRVEDVRQEINVLRKCRHPNIVSYYGSSATSTELWIMMEFCQHGSLSSIIDTFAAVDKKLTEKQLAYILYQAVTGLSYLHDDQMKVIHRDLKCGNILVGDEGVVKLADFGISFQLTGSRSKAATMIGTPLFMSPEMLGGDPYNSKTDIWSLGITAIEMADGVPPFFKDHQMRALYRIMNDEPPTLADPSKWSPQFVSFISTCLKKEPSERPTAAALLEHEFLRQFKPEETKTVMKYLLSQYQDARREVQKRKQSSGSDNGGCLKVPCGAGGGLTTLSTLSTSEAPETTSASQADKDFRLTTLSTAGPLASAYAMRAAKRHSHGDETETDDEPIKLQSSNSAPILLQSRSSDDTEKMERHDTERDDTKKIEQEADEGDVKASSEQKQKDHPVRRHRRSASLSRNHKNKVKKKQRVVKSDNEEQHEEPKTPRKKADSQDASDDEKSSEKGGKKGKSKKKKSKGLHKKEQVSQPSDTQKEGSTPAPFDRRRTLGIMHSNQSSLAFFTGLSRGAQQLLSKDSITNGNTAETPHTIEDHIKAENPPQEDAAVEPDDSNATSDDTTGPPRTLAELSKLVGNLDEYLAMPLVQLIYELHTTKQEHDQLSKRINELTQPLDSS